MSSNNRTTTRVTILGSGTCVPSLERSSCSILIETGHTKLLFDAGPGTMRRLLEAGVTIFDISYIFFSHFHPDHTGELVSFLFSTKYPDENRRPAPLTIAAGKGFLNFYGRLKKAYGQWIELAPDALNIVELDNQARDCRRFEAFTVESLPVAHNDESIAFRVADLHGKSIVYSGDTDFCDNLVILARNADLFICESALPDGLKAPGHLTPSLAGEVAKRANVGQLILTHFYPECQKVDIEKECRQTYPGQLKLAADLMQIKL